MKTLKPQNLWPLERRSVGAVAITLSLAACTHNVQVPEATTELIPSQGGTLLSADGRFGVKVAVLPSATQLSIITRGDLEIAGLASKVYEVRAADETMKFEEAFYDFTGVDAPHTKLMVTVDDNDVQRVPSYWDIQNNRLLAPGVGLSRRLFAVLELGFRNGDCAVRSCDDSCTYCDPSLDICRPQQGRCDLMGQCVLSEAVACTTGVDGWDDSPGQGNVFVINSLAIAEQNRGFDIDGECSEVVGCLDNALWGLGSLVNDQIRQGVLGGDFRELIELSGLDDPYRGEDASITVKIYNATDADDPFFPANDFAVPFGSSEPCCQFVISPQSLSSLPPQARIRAPARITQGRLRTLASVPLQTSVAQGAPPYPEMRIERALLSARLAADRSELTEGLIGGAIAVSTLAGLENPFCRVATPRCPEGLVGSSQLDLVTALVGPQPDIDLDFDGLECALDTTGDGRVDRCCDGEADACGTCSHIVPPIDASVPGSCALDPRMADGYSIAYVFTAVRAEVVGISGAPRAVNVVPSNLDFGQVALGASAQLSVAITNDGPAPVEVTDIIADLHDTGAFTSQSPLAVIPVGGSMQVRLTFAPGSPGRIESTLRIRTSAPDRSLINVPLVGEGI